MDREKRINAMWRRFCRLALKQDAGKAECFIRAVGESRIYIMRHHLHGFPTGFAPQSAIEAAELHLHQYTPTQSLEPTDAIPGTPEKIKVLAMRAESGQELWHANDAKPCLD